MKLGASQINNSILHFQTEDQGINRIERYVKCIKELLVVKNMNGSLVAELTKYG